MLLAIALILLVLWLLGFIVVPVGGNLIHILLIVLIVLVILHFARRRRSG
jgi:hypothetical protein